MINLTLKQLRYFRALAQHGHFGRAAAACSVTQPALSVQIRELETTVGQSLFERAPRQVRLTGFGQEFLERVENILRAVDDLGEFARSAQSALSGPLRLGVIPTVAPYLLPRVLSAVAQSYPGLDIHIRESLTARLAEELDQGRLDAAIVALPVSEAAFEEVPLFSEEFLLVRSKAAEGVAPPSLQDLGDHRLLLLEEGHCFRDQALSVCNIGPSQRRDGLDASSLSTLVQMVGAGLGITLIPEMAQPVETRSASVTVSRFQGPAPGRTIGMIWRKTTPMAEELAQIAEIVRKAGEPAQAA